jgi:hypothetical protein
MVFPGFIGGTYQSDSLDADAQDVINWYPEAVESGSGRNKVRFVPTPGKHLFTTLPTTPLRGLWAGANRLFAVAGSHLYEVFAGGTYTDRGDVGDDSGHSIAEIFPNGNQILVISAGQAYCDNGAGPIACRFLLGGTVNVAGTAVTWVSGSKFSADLVGSGRFVTINGSLFSVATYNSDTSITLSTSGGTHTGATYSGNGGGLVTASTGCFLDSFFIVAKPDTSQLFISASNDGTSWDPDDVATKEGYPDAIASMYADHEELYLFGNETSEVWRNEGNPGFPFQRDPGAFLHMGIVGTYTRVRLDSNVFVLGGDARGRVMAYMLQGFLPKRISTHAIEKKWSTYSTVDDAEAFAYTAHGHSFWVINFPTANATWVFDLTTGLWHRRGYWDGTAMQRDRARCHAYIFGMNLVGDFANGKIYQQSNTFYDDFGGNMQRVRCAPYIYEEELRVRHNKFQLDAETGSGSLTYSLDWSDDKATTYKTAKTRTVASGNHDARFLWWRLGESRHRIYRLTITGQVKAAITNALLDVTPCTN